VAAIKLTKREVLQATLDEARRRLYQQAKELQKQSKCKDDQARAYQDQIKQVAEDIGNQKHANLLKKINKLVQAAFPDAKVSLHIDMEKDANLRRYKPDGKAKLRLYLSAEEELADFPRDRILELDQQSDQAWAESRRLYEEANKLERQARDYDKRDLMHELVMKLPDQAGPLLDALIKLVEQAS
jgi:hypothetical protein